MIFSIRRSFFGVKNCHERQWTLYPLSHEPKFPVFPPALAHVTYAYGPEIFETLHECGDYT